jgi:hypothetical protein
MIQEERGKRKKGIEDFWRMDECLRQTPAIPLISARRFCSGRVRSEDRPLCRGIGVICMAHALVGSIVCLLHLVEGIVLCVVSKSEYYRVDRTWIKVGIITPRRGAAHTISKERKVS